MTVALDDLRREHLKLVIGPLILDLLERLVIATAPTYPAAEYSETGRWDDEALRDLLQSWIETRLLRRADLGAMMGAAHSLSALKAMLTTSLGQFLINGRRRSSALNLFKRARSMLAADPRFRPVGKSTKHANQAWSLASQVTDDLSSLDRRELVAASFELSDQELGVIRYGPFSLKSSPILREQGLGLFVSELLQAANGGLTLAQIIEVMRHRFNLIELGAQNLDEALAATATTTPTVVERDELARSVVSRMGRERITALREFHASDGQFRAVATALAVTENQASILIKETMSMIADYCESSEEAIAVYERVVESLF